MLEVKKTDKSVVRFPVGRKSKCNGEVVIFWGEERATVVSPGETTDQAGLGQDGWAPAQIKTHGSL